MPIPIVTRGSTSMAHPKNSIKNVKLNDDDSCSINGQPIAANLKLQRKMKKTRDLKKQKQKGKIMNGQEFPSYFQVKPKGRRQCKRIPTSLTLLDAATLTATSSGNEKEDASLEILPEVTSFFHIDHKHYCRTPRARVTTLFESAALFNEKGERIEHSLFDDFNRKKSVSDPFYGLETNQKIDASCANKDEMKSIGEYTSLTNQRGKRGRKRCNSKKKRKSSYVATRSKIALSKDQIINEIMSQLLPEIDVIHELNTQILGSHSLQINASPKEWQVVDLQAFRYGLQKVLFKEVHGDDEVHLPPNKTSNKDVLDMYITHELVYCLINDLENDHHHSSSYRLDILMAIYNVCPNLRSYFFRALTNCASAWSSQWENENVFSSSSTRVFTSINGYLQLLRLLFEDFKDEMFYDNDVIERIVDERNALYDMFAKEAGRTISYLIRYPSVIDSTASYLDCELLMDVVGLFVFLFPKETTSFVRSILRRWPKGYSIHEVLYLQVLQSVLMCAAREEIQMFEETRHFIIFKQLASCIKSPHIQVSKQAILLCGNPQLQQMYISRCNIIFNIISSALHENTIHWNSYIRQTSDHAFDQLLDFA